MQVGPAAAQLNRALGSAEKGGRALVGLQAVLFDADGVIQSPSTGWRAAFDSLLGGADKSTERLREVFAAERPALIGDSDFPSAFGELLSEWNPQASAADALRGWTMIEPHAETLSAIAALRRTGVRCYLATNQERYRARHMSEFLGYREQFDDQFYSCDLRVMKPEVQFFHAILARIRLPPSCVLFLDDNEANVIAAREVGLRASVFSIGSAQADMKRTLAELGLLSGR
jgi:putative hydrolase of the HAD superfamily